MNSWMEMDMEKKLTLSHALCEEYRDPEAYLEQGANVLRGFFLVSGW